MDSYFSGIVRRNVPYGFLDGCRHGFILPDVPAGGGDGVVVVKIGHHDVPHGGYGQLIFLPCFILKGCFALIIAIFIEMAIKVEGAAQTKIIVVSRGEVLEVHGDFIYVRV